MDYEELAKEFMKYGHKMAHAPAQKRISGLTKGEMFVLNYLNFKEDNALPSKISKVMDVSSARMAIIMKGLEGKGWIERYDDKNDKRKTIVHITEAGRQVVRNECEAVVHVISEAFRKIGEEDAKEYVRITKKFVGEIQFNEQ